jgi:hypothetical protein
MHKVTQSKNRVNPYNDSTVYPKYDLINLAYEKLDKVEGITNYIETTGNPERLSNLIKLHEELDEILSVLRSKYNRHYHLHNQSFLLSEI